MMKSYFHVGDSETILFGDLKTRSPGAMVGACFAIFALGMLYEGIKFTREYLYRRQRKRLSERVLVVNNHYLTSSSHGSLPGVTPSKVVLQESLLILIKTALKTMFTAQHLLQTVLNVVQVTLSYSLMLIVMTYNAWLALSVFLGVGAGYCVFGWRDAVKVEENQDG